MNLLGEVVIGDGEADKRYQSYLEALKEPDINYISVKISGIYAQTHALNYKESFPELIRRMSELYQAAIDNPYTTPEGVTRPKFINLDMEEYKDAHLTMKLFKDVLSLPQFMPGASKASCWTLPVSVLPKAPRPSRCALSKAVTSTWKTS